MIKDFLKSSANVLFADIGTKVIGFGVISALTFLLDPVTLGKYNALLTTITSLYAMSGLGIGLVLQRESAKYSIQRDSIMGEMISAGYVCMTILIIALILFFQLFHEKINTIIFGDIDASLIVWIPVLTFLYFLVQSPLTILLGMGLFKIYSFRNMIEAIITGICVLTGGYLAHLQGIIYGLLISFSINGVIVWWILRKSFLNKDIHLRINKVWTYAKKILGQGIPYFIGNTFLGAVANIVLIGLFSRHIGFAELGYLRLGLGLGLILMVIPNAVRTVTVTFIAGQELKSTMLQSLQIRYLFSLIVTCTLIMALVLKPIVSLIFGNEYDAGVNVYTMVILINVVFTIQQILNSFVVGRGKLLLSGMINGILAILYVFFSVILIPLYGIDGYYIAFGGSYFLGLIILLIYELSKNNYDNKKGLIFFLIGSFFIMSVSIIYYSSFQRSWEGNFISILLIGIYNLFCIKYLFRDEEKAFLTKMLSRANVFSK